MLTTRQMLLMCALMTSTTLYGVAAGARIIPAWAVGLIGLLVGHVFYRFTAWVAK